MSRPRRMRPRETKTDGYVGICRCCGKRAYEDRKSAKKYASRQYPGERMQAYTCRKGGVFWHVGHVAAEVLSGEVPKTAFYGPNGVGRVREKQGTRIVRKKAA